MDKQLLEHEVGKETNSTSSELNSTLSAEVDTVFLQCVCPLGLIIIHHSLNRRQSRQTNKGLYLEILHFRHRDSPVM